VTRSYIAMKPTVLVIERSNGDSESIQRMLDSAAYAVQSVEDPREAKAFVNQQVDLVMCDLGTDRDAAFFFMNELHEQSPQTALVFLVEKGDVEAAVEAMKHGAVDCLAKPLDPRRLREVAKEWTESRTSHGETRDQDQPAVNGHHQAVRRFDIPEGTSLEELEWAAVQQALEHNRGNRTHAAQELGISVRTLQRKLKTRTKPRVLL
jgi:DNA-binding NtrC family response regulator